MEIRRTANSGVLLKLDGLSFLLDGICKDFPPYEGTPESIRKELTESFPDAHFFTHSHPDHYDDEYSDNYTKSTARPVYGPCCRPCDYLGKVKLSCVETRHIGKNDTEHVSFILEGSKCVWFVGDASPLVWKKEENLPKPDVLIVPYAYAITQSAWLLTKELGAEKIILLHLPKRENDTYNLWEAVENTTKGESCLCIPDMNETIVF